jgi:methionyl-tRNA synthetase
MYVWFDALINYITAIGYGNKEREQAVGFEKFWPALHLVGKDILRFHAVYWPAFLIAGGIELPRAIVAHGMWVDPVGRKMSKTLRNVIELDVLHKHFSIDAIRYFVLREMVFGQDGRFGYEALIDRANSDLASGWGNLSSRTLTMIGRYCDSRIPSGVVSADGFIENARDQFLQHLENLAFSRALETAWSVIARVDKVISDAKPWDLAKDENQKQTLGAVLYQAAESLRWLSVLLHPFMPNASQAMWTQLGLDGSPAQVNPKELEWGELKEGSRIGDVQPVFPRIDKAKTMSEINKDASAAGSPGVHVTEADAVSAASETTQPAPPMTHATEADAVGVTSFIEIDDFAKVDLRVGQVLSAERIPKADKLLLMKIDLAEEQPRQVLAGIAQYYEPEKLVGRKVVVVANLKPRKLRGLESQGMVVAASYGEEGRPVLATFTEDVPNGARLK